MVYAKLLQATVPYFCLKLQQDGIPEGLGLDTLTINTVFYHQASYQCMIQHGDSITASSELQLEIIPGIVNLLYY